MYDFVILTVSDSASQGQREDLSGPAIREFLEEAGYRWVATDLVADEKEEIKEALIHFADDLQAPLILTTGGTGFSPRDITPEATLEIMDRNAFGIAEEMRRVSRKITNRAILSRGVSVIRGSSLIINLPGSPKACVENLQAIIEPLFHGLEILRGDAKECARS